MRSAGMPRSFSRSTSARIAAADSRMPGSSSPAPAVEAHDVVPGPHPVAAVDRHRPHGRVREHPAHGALRREPQLRHDRLEVVPVRAEAVHAGRRRRPPPSPARPRPSRARGSPALAGTSAACEVRLEHRRDPLRQRRRSAASTSWPPWNTSSVGIERMLKASATRGFSSTFSLPTFSAAGVGRRERVDRGRDHPARRAPLGPEVDQHRAARTRPPPASSCRP